MKKTFGGRSVDFNQVKEANKETFEVIREKIYYYTK